MEELTGLPGTEERIRRPGGGVIGQVKMYQI
jgi:hypothetical protein